MAGKSYNNDIFKIITELDKKNYDFFKSFDEKQYKELQPYTLLRWLSSVQGGSEYYIQKTNEVVNTRLFNLSDHKDLLLNLLCSCGCGHWTKHNWVGITREKKMDKEDAIIKEFYKLNDDEWKIKKEVINTNEVKDILNYLGLNDKRK